LKVEEQEYIPDRKWVTKSFFCKTDAAGYLSLQDYSLDNMDVENILAEDYYGADASGNKIMSGFWAYRESPKFVFNDIFSTKDFNFTFYAPGADDCSAKTPYNYTFTDICAMTAGNNYDFVLTSGRENFKDASSSFWKDIALYGEGAQKEDLAVSGRRLILEAYEGDVCDDSELFGVYSIKLSENKQKTSFCAPIVGPYFIVARYGGSVEINGDTVTFEDFKLPDLERMVDDLALRSGASKDAIREKALPKETYKLTLDKCQKSRVISGVSPSTSFKVYIETRSVTDVKAANSASTMGLSVMAMIAGALLAV
jgi:hypothetical protein